jgi:hypothetical protein
MFLLRGKIMALFVQLGYHLMSGSSCGSSSASLSESCFAEEEAAMWRAGPQPPLLRLTNTLEKPSGVALFATSNTMDVHIACSGNTKGSRWAAVISALMVASLGAPRKLTVKLRHD